jgi:hypothetical protein
MVLEAANAMSIIREEIEDEKRFELSIMQTTPAPHSTITSVRRNSGGGLPDTGSLLTHGSAVVLAGNMAAAMRQRLGLGLELGRERLIGLFLLFISGLELRIS